MGTITTAKFRDVAILPKIKSLHKLVTTARKIGWLVNQNFVSFKLH